MRYIDTTRTTVACMSLMLLFNYLQRICYFIMFYFKLTNGTMVRCSMVKCCNGEIISSLLSLLGILSLTASCCCRCHRILLVVVVGGSILPLPLAAALQNSLKRLVNIRLTIHATTMDPQHQAHNSPAVLSGVWRLNLV